MRIIEIKARANGAHRNQEGVFVTVPDGWAVIPFSMQIPDTFPFVDITVENGVVSSMTAGVVPEKVVKPELPSQLDRIEAQVTYTAMITDTLLEG